MYLYYKKRYLQISWCIMGHMANTWT